MGSRPVLVLTTGWSVFSVCHFPLDVGVLRGDDDMFRRIKSLGGIASARPRGCVLACCVCRMTEGLEAITDPGMGPKCELVEVNILCAILAALILTGDATGCRNCEAVLWVASVTEELTMEVIGMVGSGARVITPPGLFTGRNNGFTTPEVIAATLLAVVA